MAGADMGKATRSVLVGGAAFAQSGGAAEGLPHGSLLHFLCELVDGLGDRHRAQIAVDAVAERHGLLFGVAGADDNM